MRGAKAQYQFGNSINRTAARLNQIAAYNRQQTNRQKFLNLTEQQKVNRDNLERQRDRNDKIYGSSNLEVFKSQQMAVAAGINDVVDGFEADITNATAANVNLAIRPYQNINNELVNLDALAVSTTEAVVESHSLLKPVATKQWLYDYLREVPNINVGFDINYTNGVEGVRDLITTEHMNNALAADPMSLLNLVDKEKLVSKLDNMASSVFEFSTADAELNSVGGTNKSSQSTSIETEKILTDIYMYTNNIGGWQNLNGDNMFNELSGIMDKLGLPDTDQVRVELKSRVSNFLNGVLADPELGELVDAHGKVYMGDEYNRAEHGLAAALLMTGINLSGGDTKIKYDESVSQSGQGGGGPSDKKGLQWLLATNRANKHIFTFDIPDKVSTGRTLPVYTMNLGKMLGADALESLGLDGDQVAHSVNIIGYDYDKDMFEIQVLKSSQTDENRAAQVTAGTQSPISQGVNAQTAYVAAGKVDDKIKAKLANALTNEEYSNWSAVRKSMKAAIDDPNNSGNIQGNTTFQGSEENREAAANQAVQAPVQETQETTNTNAKNWQTAKNE